MGHWFRRCNFTFYFKFVSNDKSLFSKNKILSEFNKFLTRQILNFKFQYLAQKKLKFFEIFTMFALNLFNYA